MTTIYTAVKISTTNDTNGNPRRGWYIQRIGEGFVDHGEAGVTGGTLRSADFCGFIDEAGAGHRALGHAIEPHGVVLELGGVTVTPGEYRTAKRTPFTPDGIE